MRTLLNGIRDHLADTWPHVEVGMKPDGVPDQLPYATVWLTDDVPHENTSTPGDADVSTAATVHVKSIGSSFDQAGLLSQDLDATIRDGLAIDGIAVLLIERDRASGPVRDDQIHPAPHSFYADRWYRLLTAPAPDPGS